MILGSGMAVQVEPSYEALGMRRMIAVLKFSEEYVPYAQSILAAMNELCYLVSFAKSYPEGVYLAQVSVPSEFVQDVASLFSELEAMKVFSIRDLLVFDGYRNVQMKPEYYDFASGRWNFEWSKVDETQSSGYNVAVTDRKRIDYSDLLVLKELQIDASRTTSEMAKQLELNHQEFVTHLNHAKKNGLVSSYHVRWLSRRFDDAEKMLHRKHSYFLVDLIARKLSTHERRLLSTKINALPFTVSEGVGVSYFAQLALPIDMVVEAHQYIERCISDISDRSSYYAINPMDILSFTISYRLFDKRSNAWTFNKQEIVRRFAALTAQIGKEWHR